MREHVDQILKKKSAQTSIEVAVFGSILIFVVGLIVRQSLNFSHQQNQNLKAMRWAMTKSYTTTGNASRNSASVLLVEDRLSPSSSRYGSVDRVPYFVSGSAVHSRNLEMPLAPEDADSLPVYDIFINGVHFPFTVSRMVSYPMDEAAVNARELASRGTTGNDWNPNCATDLVTGLPVGCAKFYARIINHPAILEWAPLDANRFDLNRDGNPTIEVLPGDRGSFSWQWQEIQGLSVNVIYDPEDFSKNKNTSLDFDGDLKTERLIKRPTSDSNGVITEVFVVDPGKGDLDFTYNSPEKRAGEDPPGILRDTQMYTRVKSGTYLRIEEGELFGSGNQFIRTTSKKDHVDIVVRVIKMSNDTGRFCDMRSVPAVRPGFVSFPYDSSVGYPFDIGEGSNPVEVCCNLSGCSIPGENTCFGSGTIAKTCMSYRDTDNVFIYVRSRIEDTHGHKWITDRGADSYVDFTVPPLP